MINPYAGMQGNGTAGAVSVLDHLTDLCYHCGDYVTFMQRDGLDTAPRWLHITESGGQPNPSLYLRCPGKAGMTATPKDQVTAAYIVDKYMRATSGNSEYVTETDPVLIGLDDDASDLLANLRAATPTEPDTYEEVDRPEHYDITAAGYNFQVIDLIEGMNLGFHLGNALKYLLRAGTKPGAEASTDLRKAAWYLTRRADQLDEPF